MLRRCSLWIAPIIGFLVGGLIATATIARIWITHGIDQPDLLHLGVAYLVVTCAAEWMPEAEEDDDHADASG